MAEWDQLESRLKDLESAASGWVDQPPDPAAGIVCPLKNCRHGIGGCDVPARRQPRFVPSRRMVSGTHHIHLEQLDEFIPAR